MGAVVLFAGVVTYSWVARMWSKVDSLNDRMVKAETIQSNMAVNITEVRDIARQLASSETGSMLRDLRKIVQGADGTGGLAREMVRTRAHNHYFRNCLFAVRLDLEEVREHLKMRPSPELPKYEEFEDEIMRREGLR